MPKPASTRKSLHMYEQDFTRLDNIGVEMGLRGWHSLCLAIARGNLVVVNPAKTATVERKHEGEGS